MATEQLPVTDGAATGSHVYPTGVTEGAALEVVYDNLMTDATTGFRTFAEDTGNTTEPPQAYADTAAADGAAVGTDFGGCYFITDDASNIEYDGTSLYEFAYTIRTAVMPTTLPSANANLYAGVTGIAADGTTMVNRSGEDNGSSQHYCAFNKRLLEVSEEYVTVYAYMRGWAASGSGGETRSPAAPGTLTEGSVYVRPLFYLNYHCADGTMYLDRVTVTRISTPEVEPADYTITVTGDTTGNTATDTVTIDSLDTDGVFNAANTGEGLDAKADISGLASDTTVLLNWGDNTPRETVTLTDGAASLVHTYAVAGTYTCSIIGTTSGAAYANAATVGSVFPLRSAGEAP
jgi:hypothetical protein